MHVSCGPTRREEARDDEEERQAKLDGDGLVGCRVDKEEDYRRGSRRGQREEIREYTGGE